MIASLSPTGAWHSLSGVRLDATKLTRAIYMDESGTNKHHRALVVAGVIVEPDAHMDDIENRLRSLIDRYIPESRRDGFVWHAAELFSGNKNLPREIQDEDVRRGILEQIISIPSSLKLPICVGMIQKEKFLRFEKRAQGKTPHQILVAMHAAAIALCTISCEIWMRAFAKSEVAWLFAEDNNEVKKAAKETQILMRSNRAAQILRLASQTPPLPLAKIKDGINFVGKPESYVLQLADACAWCARQFNSKEDRYRRFTSILKPQLSIFSGSSYDVAARL